MHVEVESGDTIVQYLNNYIFHISRIVGFVIELQTRTMDGIFRLKMFVLVHILHGNISNTMKKSNAVTITR